MEKSFLISEIVIILLSALIFLKLMIKKVEYFFTVCFVASACASILILGETVKQINYSIGVLVNAISTVVLITVYFAGGSLFKKYSEVVVPDNRVKSISVSSVVILVYLIACFINIRNMNIYICILQLILIVSVYVCFISAINKQRKISGIAKIYEVKEKLKEIAYLDSATNVKNKRARI